MSKLVAWNLITVDGYFEGSQKWELDFHSLAWGEDLEKLSEEQGDGAAALVFGRTTYEGMAAHWKTAAPSKITSFMNELPKLIASRSLRSADWNNSSVTPDIVPELRRLKSAETAPIYVFGSAILTHTLLEAGLIDEIKLCIVPLILGSGTPFFKPGSKISLRLKHSKPLKNGSIINLYEIEQATSSSVS